jgi:prevent-host-death family protein
MQVNMHEAKTRLSELVAAALRGEEVVIANAGRPVVRLVPTGDAAQAAIRERGAQRRAALGMFARAYAQHGPDVTPDSIRAGRVYGAGRADDGAAA